MSRKPFENDPELKKIIRKLSGCRNHTNSKLEKSKNLLEVGRITFNKKYDSAVNDLLSRPIF